MKKFAFIFACVSLSLCCLDNVKAEIYLSGTIDDAFDRLAPGEMLKLSCTDPFHEEKCKNYYYYDFAGLDEVFFAKKYDGSHWIAPLTCKNGYHFNDELICVQGYGTAKRTPDLGLRCDGLDGDEYNACVACSTLSNWDAWDPFEKECLVEIDVTPVAVPKTPVVQNTNITVTVTDTNNVPLPGVNVKYNKTSMVTDRYGQVTLNANIGERISIHYGSINENPKINSANMTFKMDLHWFAGMQPGEIREIDCTNADNEAVCMMENEKTGVIGLDYNAKPIAYLIMECNAGYEWFLSSRGYVECQTGTGTSRTTDFSEIAEERCKGLNGSEEESCIECTMRDWNAWDYIGKVCGNNKSITSETTPATSNIDSLRKNIEKTAEDLDKISSKFEKSRWKTASGNFNGARLASDSVAGVVLGTAGGLITSHVIKNNQIKGGFEDIQCVINGQIVSEYSDEFVVGIQ